MHHYKSIEYLIQTLGDYINTSLSDKPSFAVKRTEKRVDSGIGNIKWSIELTNYDSEKDIAAYTLEVMVEGGTVSREHTGFVKIERSNKGRVSGNTWKNFWREVIIPEVRSMKQAITSDKAKASQQ